MIQILSAGPPEVVQDVLADLKIVFFLIIDNYHDHRPIIVLSRSLIDHYRTGALPASSTYISATLAAN